MYSSQLADAYKKIGWMSNTEPTLNDWTTDETKWNDFLKLVEHNTQLISLHFMGGEPLYHKRFFEFVDWCIENKKTDFHLTFVTNGTVYKEDLVEKLSKFKSVQIEISIENLHETNNYIRMGFDFNDIKENISKFIDKKLRIILRTVPQALSIENYDTILDFAIEHNLGFDSNILDNPKYLKCVVLPKELKFEIANKIRSKYTHILTSNSNINEVVHYRSPEGIKKHIESLLVLLEEAEPKNIEELRYKFIEHNKQLDTVCNLKFTGIYPKLFDFYEKYSKI